MALKKLKKFKGITNKSNTKTTSNNSSTTNDIQRQASNLKTRLEASGVSTDKRNWLQKALNLEEDMGFLAGLGDVLDRPGNAVRAMIAGDPLKSAGQNAWEALTGQQRVSGADVIETFNPDFANASGVEKFIGSLATEILLDPTTYLSLGAGAVAKGATTAGTKALGAVDDVADVAKILKTTKTADQAADVIKGTKAIKGVKNATRADDLLSASKLYRAADVADTIANPLKLVPIGAKKAGSAAMKTLDKVNPDIATGLRKMGDEFTKTFNYKKWLKSNLGDDIYKKLKRGESISEASLAAVSAKSGEQYKLLQKVFREIKKDPDRAWTTISKIDGHKEVFKFAGMTDDEIMKKLNEFATNQVYFDRPTVLDENAIRLLTRNKGQLKLAAQDFKNADDLEDLVTSLQKVVDDPDLVSVHRYVQPETGKKSGWVIDIGERNARKLEKIFNANYSDEITKQLDTVTKRQTSLQKAQDKVDLLDEKIAKAATDEAKEKLLNRRNTEIAKLTKNQTSVEQAVQQLDSLKGKQSDLDNLFKTRELVPFEAPILDTPEMKQIANLQRELVDTNLGFRNLGGMSVKQMDTYTNYVHRKLTDTSRAYIQTTKAKNDPTLRFLIGANDKLPAQAAMSNLYGNFSATEVNTMMGFDLFDNNIVSANLDMVNKLNRRSYNTELTRALFTESNDWVINSRNLDDMSKVALREQGFVPVSSTEIASKLRLNEILNEEDIAKITKGLKGQQFYMSKDVVELFDKNAKLYKQLDSQFYQQLNKYMKYWKGGNLLSVGYHLRNWFGAQTNMALAGMGLDDVARYSAQAGLDIGKYNTKLLPEFTKWISDPTNADIFKTGTLDDVAKSFGKQVGEKDAKLFTELLDAQLNGAWGGIVGQHDAVKRAIGEMPKSKLGRVADKVQDINYKIGATSDDINRLAAYRWAQNPKNYGKITKVGAQDALDFVHYAMFDFKSMSPTEQAYFTKIFPFYNFIKNNLTFQFTNMTKNTQRYNVLAKAYKNLYSSQELTNEDVQQYVKDQLYIPIKQADGSIKVLKIAPPVQDATNLLNLKNILGASNPLIQYITDRAYGEDLYTGADLGSDRTKNTQELVDLLPYGRSIRTTLDNPLGILLPVSSTTVEKGRNQNAYAELERLEKLRKQYKQQTGQSLPTLEELGLK